MHLITVDFETHYSKDFSLSKLTTEEYIRSPEFEVIGVSVKLDDEPAVWCTGDDLEVFTFLQKFPWDKSLAVAHNAMFDMAILSWKYGIKPLALGDTLSMARALHGSELGMSLKALAEHYKLQAKGEEVVAAMGMRRADFSPHGLKTYGAYCINDTEITHSLFGLMSKGFRVPFGDDLKQLNRPGFPRSEMRLIDQTLRMFTEPVLGLDKDVLVPHLQDVKHKKALLMAEIDVQREDLMSNPKLAESLRKLGVEPPTKISAATGKETYAFSKSDSAFTDLLEHPDLPVQALVAARLGVKSTLEETRTERFIGMADRGPMPVPLRYYGAHTGRWAGSDKINLQNITRGSPLNTAITAPEGHVIINCDSSQIEARVLAWLAGQEDLVAAFDRGEDVYRVMASSIYNKPVDAIDKDERFLGKTVVLGCLAEGTLVMTRRGWVPIEAVEPTDLLWDGDAWVGHEGLIPKGTKETLSLYGLWLTPDHRVLCGTQWLEAASLEHDESTLSLALATGAVSWLSPDTSPELGVELVASSYAATASGPSMSSTTTTSKTSAVRDAPRVGAGRGTKNATGCTPPLWPTTPTGHGSLTGYPQPSHAATTQLTAHTQLMEGGVSRYVRSGATTEPRSLHTCKPYPAGTLPSSKWTALITVEGTSPITYGSLQEQKTWATAEPSVSCRRNLMTYDLAYAGPRNRYTVRTDAGPVIVHNCGYGTGWLTFQKQLKLKGVTVTDDVAQSIIQTYREAYPRIPLLWKEAGRALDAILDNATAPLGTEGALVVEGNKGVRLPNGLHIRYPNLRWEEDDGKRELVYDTKRGRTVVKTRIHGPKCLAGDTEVLTPRGWVAITNVTTNDKVWDGVEWVKHDGLIYQGEKVTTILDGVRMTPDHKVLTTVGWRDALSCEGLHRANFRVPDGHTLCGSGEALRLAVPLPLREYRRESGRENRAVRPPWGRFLVWLRMGGEGQVAWHVKAPGVLGVALDARSLPLAVASSLGKLRRSWSVSVPRMGQLFRGFLGGHGSDICAGAYARPRGQQWALHPRELSVGDQCRAGGEQTVKPACRHIAGAHKNKHTPLDLTVSVAPEAVYDLRNAGPRTRFMVRGATGPLIVHNCVENVTQALARIIIGDQLLMVARRYRVALTVHDSIVAIAPASEEAKAAEYITGCMKVRPKWAPTLPLSCEAKTGANYG